MGSITEFHFLRIIGRGRFSEVVLAKKDKTLYAIKVLDKHKALDSEHILYERQALQTVRFPFIIHTEYYFSDTRFIYVVMPYIPGGDLWFHLRKINRMAEEDATFYASQVVLALEHLHSLQIIYRDIKPENIMIDFDGYIKLVDLGFCKKIQGRTYTFCGTVEYMSPEVLLNKGYGLGADWWSFGVLLYEMVGGRTPFLSKDEFSMCQKITAGDYIMPKLFSKDLQNVIRSLFEVDPTKRLGAVRDGVLDIRCQPWFHSVNWTDLLNKGLTPPFVPKVHGQRKSRIL